MDILNIKKDPPSLMLWRTKGGENKFMNKGITFAIVIVLVVIGGGMYISNQQSQQAKQAKMAQEKASMKAAEDAAMKKDETVMDKTAASRYVEYSKSALNQAVGGRRVLYFYANWCPICRPADANFKENASKIPENATVIRVNYNDSDTDQEEKDLAKKYGIIYQHTFVQIDEQGNQVTKWNGGQIDELLANIK